MNKESGRFKVRLISGIVENVLRIEEKTKLCIFTNVYFYKPSELAKGLKKKKKIYQTNAERKKSHNNEVKKKKQVGVLLGVAA